MDGDIWWPELCGQRYIYDAYWSYSLTINTTNPDLTNCFQQTALTWTSTLALVLSAAVYMPFVKGAKENAAYKQSTRIRQFRLLLITLMIGLAVIELIHVLVKQFDPSDEVTAVAVPVEYIALCVKIPTYVFIIVLEKWTTRRGIHSPAILFIYWLLALIFGIVTFRSKILQLQNDLPVEWVPFVTFYIYFALMLAVFVTLFTPGKPLTRTKYTRSQKTETTPLLDEEHTEITGTQQRSKPCPKLTASFPSLLIFSWLSKRIWLGWKRTLVWDDIWDIRKEDTCEAIVPLFEKEWNKELKKAKLQKRKCTTETQKGETTTNMKGSASLTMAIGRTFPLELIICAATLVLDYSASLLNPLILQLLIDFVESDDSYQWKGYIYAVAMFVCSFISLTFMQHSVYMEFYLGQKLRTALTSVIYKKALRLSSVARKSSTVGEIVNLMSVDVQKVQQAVAMINFVWTPPLMIAAVTAMLWQYLGPSCLAGVGAMVMLLPVTSTVLAKLMKRFQKVQMDLKDQRIKLVNQVLGGIKVLKLYAWEPYFEQKVQELRSQEIWNIRKGLLLEGLTYVIYFCSSFLVALISFAVFVLSDPTHVLDARTAFVSLALFNMLNFPLTAFPWALMVLVQANVSIVRIAKFLQYEEVDPNNVHREYTEDCAVRITGGKFSWGEEDRMPLDGINMSVGQGKLVAIVGQVGSGKSSLLHALLGEMVKLKGTVNVLGSTAYVPQQSWIQNMSLKENILFNTPLNEDRYRQVLEGCALEPDLKILPSGDETEIGERGINLSGGQKARVSLARAVYQNSDIYLLDDPLSAVDAHVGKHIYEKVLGSEGMLKHKTRVLVTNQLRYLPKADEIIVMKDGCMSEKGTYEELLSHNGAFAEFVRTYLIQHEKETDSDDEVRQQRIKLEKQISVISSKSGEDNISQHSGSGTHLRHRKTTYNRTITRDDAQSVKSQSVKNVKKQQLIGEEEAEVGNIRLSVIKAYMKAATLTFTLITVLSCLLFIGASVGTNIWLSEWSGDQPVNGTMDRDQVNLRLGVYGGLGMFQTVGVMGIALGIALGGMEASNTLHNSLLSNTLKLPMSFFDTTPLGRIVNRFSKDIDILDINIPLQLQNLITTVAPLLSTFIIILYSTPIFTVVLVPLAILFIILQRVYVKTSRQLKRYDSIKRSPIYAFFSETLNGATSIRAYKQQNRFINHLEYKLDESQRVYYESTAVNRWVCVWAELLGNLVVLFTALFAVIQKDTLDPGLVGLSISYSLTVSMGLLWTVRVSGDLETNIVAVERVKEYSDLNTEAPWHIEDCIPPHTWPEEGVVTFNKLSTKYRPELELVLKQVTCKINSQEKVGIVGRTGAGKSSMTLSLFRIIEPTFGSIEIDGRNIGNIGLHDVRSKITIIPQDPVLFSGPLRFNIDPSDSYTDDEVWTAVEHAHLRHFVRTLPNSLQYECGEEGENLSVGQRQLVCLARALLRKTKILVLDEATASVDLETDELIQSTIRTEFKDCTVITIAHRLNTILDYDRVMVLSAGEITEFESPSKLLKQPTSMFYSMAKDAGLV